MYITSINLPRPKPPIRRLGPGGGPLGPLPELPALYVDSVFAPLLVRSGVIIVRKLKLKLTYIIVIYKIEHA